MTRLENWAVVSKLDNYLRLTGNVYSHPNKRHSDGKCIVTSIIVNLDIKNKTAKTYSGTRYELGKPKRDWVNWLAENSPSYYKEVINIYATRD